MLTLNPVSKQVMGLVSLTPPNFEAGIPPRVLSITGGEVTVLHTCTDADISSMLSLAMTDRGQHQALVKSAGTGRYTGASGTYLSTMPSLAPTTSAPASPGADAIALIPACIRRARRHW